MKKLHKFSAIILSFLMVMNLAACQTSPTIVEQPAPSEPAPSEPAPAVTKPQEESKISFAPGTYEGSANGMYGAVPVTVTVSESRIESVVVGENKETLGVGDVAGREITSQIIDEQSLAVDIVSGATISSYAIISAAKEALKEAGGDINVLTKAKSENPIENGSTENVDVVIVGAGLAGLNAAYDLKIKNPDIKFVVLEKRGLITGALPLSGGSLLADHSVLHDSMGFDSSVSDIILQMETAAKGPVREDLITNVFSLSEEIFNRLYDWGAPLYSEENYFNPYVPTNPVPSSASSGSKVHSYFANGSGGGYAKFWYDHVEANPLDIRVNSEVTDLIVSEGKVTGVKVKDNQKEYEIYAKAVLLATGGFGSNPKYVEQYSPNYVGGINRSNSGATGDGITMTKQFNTPVVGIGLGMISGELQAAYNVVPISTGFNVDLDGNSVGRYSIAGKLTSGTETIYTIIDSKFADNEMLKKHMDLRLIEPYDTLEELAEAKSINIENLKSSIITNNETADAVKIDTAPYYAERIYHSWSGSYPGIKIDDHMRVLDGSDNPVTGLYAAGELTTANFYYGGFPGLGVAGSLATYSGPYAARCIADDLK